MIAVRRGDTRFSLKIYTLCESIVRLLVRMFDVGDVSEPERAEDLPVFLGKEFDAAIDFLQSRIGDASESVEKA